jgi:hypothetical protein
MAPRQIDESYYFNPKRVRNYILEKIKFFFRAQQFFKASDVHSGDPGSNLCIDRKYLFLWHSNSILEHGPLEKRTTFLLGGQC